MFDTFSKDVVKNLSDINLSLKGLTFDKLRDVISPLFGSLSEGLKAIFEPVSQFFNWLLKNLSEAWKYIIDFFRGLVPENIAKLFERFWEVLPDWLKDIITKFGDFLTNWYDYLRDFFKDPIGFLKERVWKPLIEAFKDFIDWVWEKLPEPVREFLSKLAPLLRNLWEYIFMAITNPLGFLNVIFGLFTNLFSMNISATIRTVLDGLSGGFKPLIDPIFRFVFSILDILKGFVEGMIDRIRATGEFFMGLFMNKLALPFLDLLIVKSPEASRKAWEEVSDLAEKLAKHEPVGEVTFMVRILVPILRVLAPLVLLPTAIEEALKVVPPIEKEVDLRPFGIGASARVHLRPAQVFKTIIKTFEHIAGLFRDAFVLGFAIHLFEPIARLFFAFSILPNVPPLRNVLPVALPTLTEGKELVRRFLPTNKATEIFEHYRWILKLRGFSDYNVDLFASFVETDLYKKIITEIKEHRIEVLDRFGQKRFYPVSWVYDLPTHSELVRMMIRDIFYSPVDFARIIAMRGYLPDIAFMYYLLHYRYPSPEKLWEFTCRGLAGMLWVTEAQISLDSVEESMMKDFKIGYSFKAPRDLNIEGKVLFSALRKYLRWHDYFFASWVSPSDVGGEYTSDRAIIMDLMADIPTRIDARWMWKWGIFSGLGRETVNNLAPTIMKAIAKAGWEGATVGESFDALMLARINIARGMHPEWIPFVTLAEMWNAYAEERTLLRTGIINLYKEGFWERTTMDSLMKEFFRLKFTILKWDSTNLRFVTDTVDLPVKFLEGERKLLQLRAVMDRAIDIMRDAHRESLYSALENIIKIEEYINVMKSVINDINDSFFKSEIKEITGLPEERLPKLTLDMKYYNVYTKIIERYKDVYTYRRLRYWLSRIMWNVYYRLMRGYISKAEVENFIGEIVKRAKLTDKEKETLLFIAHKITEVAEREITVRAILRKLARMIIKKEEALKMLLELGIEQSIAEALIEYEVRGYIPTVTQIATISEVVPEASKFIDEIMELRGVPPHHRDMWRKYVTVKPLVDELRMYRTALITAYARGVISEAEFTSALGFLKAFGWTDKEIEIIKKIAEVRRKYYEERIEGREYIPTPMQLATIVEVVPIAVKFVNHVFEARRVPIEWRPIWKTYIEIKPLIDEIKLYKSTLISSYARGLISIEEFSKALKQLENFGYTEKELQFIKRVAEIRRQYYEMREEQRQYIPTPAMFITILEYVPEAWVLFENVMKQRRVPEEWINVWRLYALRRPLYDEVRRTLTSTMTLFIIAGMDLDKLRKEIEPLLGFGLTKEEYELIIKNSLLRRNIEVLRRVVPSFTRLSYMYEDVKEALDILMSRIEELLKDAEIPRETKETLKKLWKEFARIRSVRRWRDRYITELIMSYARGVLSDDELERELNFLRGYGLRDEHIMFIKRTAKLRRRRYAVY